MTEQPDTDRPLVRITGDGIGRVWVPSTAAGGMSSIPPTAYEPVRPVGTPEPPSGPSDDPHEWLTGLLDGKDWAWGPTAVVRRVGMLVAEVDRLRERVDSRTAVPTREQIAEAVMGADADGQLSWDTIGSEDADYWLRLADAVLALFSQPRPEHTIEDYARAYWLAGRYSPSWVEIGEDLRENVRGRVRAVLDLAGVPVADPEHEPAWKVGDRVEHTIHGIGEVIEHRPHLKNLPYLIRFGDGQGWFEAGDVQEAPPEPQRPEWVRLTMPVERGASTLGREGDTLAVGPWTADGWPGVRFPNDALNFRWLRPGEWEPADPPPPEPEPNGSQCCSGCSNPNCPDCGEGIARGDEWMQRQPAADPPVVPAPPVCHAAHADDALMHLRCRLSKGHQGDHRDGSCSWAAASPTVLVEPTDEELARLMYDTRWGYIGGEGSSWGIEPAYVRGAYIAAVRAVRDALAAKEDRP